MITETALTSLLAFSQPVGFQPHDSRTSIHIDQGDSAMIGFRLTVSNAPSKASPFQSNFEFGAHRLTDEGYDFLPFVSFADNQVRSVFRAEGEEEGMSDTTLWLIGGGLVLVGVAAFASGDSSDDYKCEASGIFENLCP